MHKERLHHLHPTVWLSFKRGDKKAYALLYESYFARLYNYGLKFTKDKLLVEDAIQDLFVKLWQHRDTLGDPASVTNYLYKSLRSILFNKLTRGDSAFQHPANLEEYHFEVVPSPEADFIHNHLADARREQLAKALAALTPRQREAIFLKFYEGLSYEEIAEIMAVNVKAVYKIMARALVTLKSSLPKIAALFLAGILLFPFFR
jgi:RNA polymerase sigma factor (sigma-70 family)